MNHLTREARMQAHIDTLRATVEMLQIELITLIPRLPAGRVRMNLQGAADAAGAALKATAPMEENDNAG